MAVQTGLSQYRGRALGLELDDWATSWIDCAWPGLVLREIIVPRSRKVLGIGQCLCLKCWRIDCAWDSCAIKGVCAKCPGSAGD